MDLFMRVMNLVTGIILWGIGFTGLVCTILGANIPESNYYTCAAFFFSSVGFLFAEKLNDERMEIAEELCWVNRQYATREMCSDVFRREIEKQLEIQEELKEEIEFLRSKYHDDIEVFKDAV